MQKANIGNGNDMNYYSIYQLDISIQSSYKAYFCS